MRVFSKFQWQHFFYWFGKNDSFRHKNHFAGIDFIFFDYFRRSSRAGRSQGTQISFVPHCMPANHQRGIEQQLFFEPLKTSQAPTGRSTGQTINIFFNTPNMTPPASIQNIHSLISFAVNRPKPSANGNFSIFFILFSLCCLNEEKAIENVFFPF